MRVGESGTFIVGGLETGGTWCVCAVGSGPEEILAREQIPTSDPATTLIRIVDFFRAGPALDALGVGSFGPVDVHTNSPHWGEVTNTPKPGWSGVPVGRHLQRELGIPVYFDTDVAAAAIGEHRWGAGRDVANLCYMTVGTGIGAALLFDGTPWHGIVHPEAGHMRVPHDLNADPFPGACPYHGDCLEGLASGRAISERWGRDPKELQADHPAWELEATYIAAGLANIVLTVGPERILLGGGVLEQAQLLPLIRPRLEALIGSYLSAPALDEGLERYLVAPALADDAGVIGAIAMALQHVKRSST